MYMAVKNRKKSKQPIYRITPEKRSDGTIVFRDGQYIFIPNEPMTVSNPRFPYAD